MRRTRFPAALVAAALAGPLAGCSASAAPDAASEPRSITVFAAASLTGVFTELADEFEAANPGTSVELSFAGSSDLATQIENGAPADVFASADIATMRTVQEAGLTAADPVPFATNVLEIAVPPGNPAGVRSLADLAREGVATVVCAPQVPCGVAADAVERAAGLVIEPVSEESSVTDVLGKVRSGEADAGLVYVTDVRGAGDDVLGVPFAEAEQAVNTYPIAPLTDSDAATAFAAFVTGATGRAVLDAAGFGAP
ncbi:molybdate ABC transporter substrate-binding protein [Rathayibacter sp. VKM Ac-2630]|uniref:molybdate ABC transporter substrate-binding protein n=1 Tax=Rathayibacter sp. VKM Ac-2630 TaxID=1938617 RepID=UPI000981AD63|nr:molybdate ABC transporter substrate-binding protein [Rathayibacter sp. VKM Ac-2630]OOB92173.1 molybdate ABC transporter substrate-binding protein [Rathayibacter sp. VKM Ac-2630]